MKKKCKCNAICINENEIYCVEIIRIEIGTIFLN